MDQNYRALDVEQRYNPLRGIGGAAIDREHIYAALLGMGHGVLQTHSGPTALPSDDTMSNL